MCRTIGCFQQEKVPRRCVQDALKKVREVYGYETLSDYIEIEHYENKRTIKELAQFAQLSEHQIARMYVMIRTMEGPRIVQQKYVSTARQSSAKYASYQSPEPPPISNCPEWKDKSRTPCLICRKRFMSKEVCAGNCKEFKEFQDSFRLVLSHNSAINSDMFSVAHSKTVGAQP